MFPGLRFESRTPAPRASTARADVACFVGFVRVRDAAEDHVRAEYARSGWASYLPAAAAEANTLAGASLPPIAVESPLAFDAMFDGWVYAAAGRMWEGMLSGAVHDFFRQGGRRAWVVPVASPFVDEHDDGRPAPPSTATLFARIEQVVPGANGGATVSPYNRNTWRGMGHLFGLPDVAMVCLPDLPGLVGADEIPEPDLPTPAPPDPAFVECAVPAPAPPGIRSVRAPGAPRLGAVERGRWQVAVAHAVEFLKRHRPDIQLLLALPLAARGSGAETNPLAEWLQLGQEAGGQPPGSHSRFWRHGASRVAPLNAQDRQRITPPTLAMAEGRPANELPGIGTAFLQLGFPWFMGDTTVDRPDGIGSPDGLIAGMVARATLMRGAFRTTASERAEGVTVLEPRLTPTAMHRVGLAEEGTEPLSLAQRVALMQQGRSGVQLRSDATTTANPRWRQAGVSRLYGVILRALREVGQTMVFEPSGPAAWRELESRVKTELAGLVEVGALAGPTPYRVQCNANTMSQNDIDNGRMVALVEVSPTLAIERLTVVLTVADASSAALGAEVA